jgi:short-subunit dehydrogenase involved in D-alanine esterification of teichoic acids
LKEKKCEGVDLFGVVQDMNQQWVSVNMVMNLLGFMKDEELFYQLSDYQLLMKDSAP